MGTTWRKRDPAGPNPDRAVAAIVWLRVATSVAWLDSAFVGKDAKWAPSFLDGSGLASRVTTTFAHSAASPGIAHLLVAVVLPHAAVFAVAIAVADAFAGISLALGFATRLGAAVSVLRAATNVAVAAGMGADTVGYNGMLIVAALICIATAAGRRFGVDARLVAAAPDARLVRAIA